MSRNWIVKQAAFNLSSLKTLTGQDDHRCRTLVERYQQSSPIAGREYNVGTAIGAIGFAAMDAAGIPFDAGSGPFRALMYYVLSELARTSLRSGFKGTPEELAQFLEWFETGNEHLDQRRLHELLNIQERAANRYLVVAGQDCFTTNDKDEAFERGDHVARKVVDAQKIADKLRNYRSDLFTFEPAKPGR